MSFFKFMSAALVGCLLAIPLTWATAKETPKDDKLVCVSNADLDKQMKDKQYGVLLTMTNENNVTETVWINGQTIFITAAVPNEDKSCLLANMKDVTYNPTIIRQIFEIYKNQTKEKDI